MRRGFTGIDNGRQGAPVFPLRHRIILFSKPSRLNSVCVTFQFHICGFESEWYHYIIKSLTTMKG